MNKILAFVKHHFLQSSTKSSQGINPELLADLKALTGDRSDNFPGLPGIGEKTAIKLIKTLGSLENIYKTGYKYQKTGIIFSDLKDINVYNKNLFSSVNNEEKRSRLMKAIDYTNTKYGRYALSIAQAGLKKKWNIKKQYSSKIDTACFTLLPTIRTS